MKQTIRTFIAKIPLAKPLYHAVKKMCHNIKNGREEMRRRCEQAQLRRKQTIIRQGSPECFDGLPLRVSWHITSFCNFRCSYCFDAGTEYKKEFCSLEQAETAIRHIASANRPSYQINLIGGEPTSHPHLTEIITLLRQYLGDRLEVLQMFSNGSFRESQMEAILEASGPINVQLYLSVHLEYMNVERVVELVKRYSARTRLEIALMFHPDLIDKAMAVAEALIALRRDYSFWMYPSMLREGLHFIQFDSRYTQEHFNLAKTIRERFGKVDAEGPQRPENQQGIIGWKFLVERKVRGVTENHEQVSLSELEKLTGNCFQGMTCIAGTNSIKIRLDGKMKGLICGLERPTCNIFKENPFLREDWIHSVFCTQTMCGCNIDYRIPKFRSPAEAQKFIAEKKLEQKKLMSEYQKV